MIFAIILLIIFLVYISTHKSSVILDIPGTDRQLELLSGVSLDNLLFLVNRCQVTKEVMIMVSMFYHGDDDDDNGGSDEVKGVVE